MENPCCWPRASCKYSKLTRGEWKRRLLQIRLSGLNAVSVYFAWNYHEQSEGEWDFSGDRDVEYFLQLAAECGLYVVARPGPFICNEWTCGGIPAWLSGKKGVRLRSSDPLYLSYCDKWWDKIAPIIAKYQLGREGTIILAQVENEYGHQGAHQEEAYIHHLRDGLRARGVTVPLINCDSFIRFDRIQPRVWEGVNLCVNSGGDGLRVLQRARSLQPDKPLFVTEYWIAAFDWWGSGKSAAYDDKRALYGGLEMLAGGAGGLTVFVVSGGSHFGYWHGQIDLLGFQLHDHALRPRRAHTGRRLLLAQVQSLQAPLYRPRRLLRGAGQRGYALSFPATWTALSPPCAARATPCSRSLSITARNR